MLTVKQLDYAFNSALNVVTFKGGFDSFKFRKGFDEATNISIEDKEEIMKYLENKIPKSSEEYQLVRKQINHNEFLSTDYYENPHPRKFRGTYAPVILKTFAGIMSLVIEQKGELTRQ
ncbi:hypothetical protein [Lentibacillus saliphilus]|uniref:hypothetical protein n=1 Tax=Lentibacillus saliphilus TaxID=2737028 RepID=UPI001C2F78A4|nr:hypothetical protein [Lentibacillus saliphilus]